LSAFSLLLKAPACTQEPPLRGLGFSAGAGGAGGLVQLATRLFHLRADVLALVFESFFRLLLPGHAYCQSERKDGRSEASAEGF